MIALYTVLLISLPLGVLLKQAVFTFIAVSLTFGIQNCYENFRCLDGENFVMNEDEIFCIYVNYN